MTTEYALLLAYVAVGFLTSLGLVYFDPPRPDEDFSSPFFFTLVFWPLIWTIGVLVGIQNFVKWVADLGRIRQMKRRGL